MSDFKMLLRELELKGRQYEQGDTLTDMLGGEKFSYVTRRVVSEMVNIIEDNPEFTSMVPDKLKMFFEGYKINWQRHASGSKITDYIERSLGRKPNVRGQGKAIAEEQKHGEYLVMFPSGRVEHAMDKDHAEQKIRQWFKLNLGADSGVGEIEWRMKTAMNKIAVAKELVKIAKSLVAVGVPSQQEVKVYMYKPQGDFLFERKPDGLYVTLYDAHDEHTVFSRGFEDRFDIEKMGGVMSNKYRITRK
jgi:hypothetical protein